MDWLVIVLIKKQCEMMCVIYILKDELSFREIEGEGFVENSMSSNLDLRSQIERRLHRGVGFIFIGEEQNIEYHRKSKG